MSPTHWWRAIKGCDIDASSASIERIFSNFAFVDAKVINRLGIKNTNASGFVFAIKRFTRAMNRTISAAKLSVN